MLAAMITPLAASDGFPTGPIPPNPLICQSHIGGVFYRLPNAVACSYEFPPDASPPQTLALTIFTENTRSYISVAKVCKIVTQRARWYTNFLSDHILEKQNEHHNVSVAECRQMIADKKCSFGTLKSGGDQLRTTNVLNIEFPPPVIGSFTWQHGVVSNCFLFGSVVSAHHGDEAAHIPLAHPRNCRYQDESCILDDGSVVVWQAFKQQSCKFTPAKVMNGTFMGNAWTAESHELALSISYPYMKVYDCGNEYVKTDQGYVPEVSQALPLLKLPKEVPKRKFKKLNEGEFAIRNRRHKRKSLSEEQLAAQLTALSMQVSQSINFAFRHNFYIICSHLDYMARLLHFSVASNPTLATRSLLNITNIHARYSTANVLEVFPCAPIAPFSFKVRKVVQPTCYEFIPVSVTYHGVEREAFLDSLTMIVSQHSRIAPCDLVEEIPVLLDGDFYVAKQLTGDLVKVNSTAFKFLSTENTRIEAISRMFIDVSSKIFHNLLISNYSEEFNSIHLEATLTAMQSQVILDEVNTWSARPNTSFTTYKLPQFTLYGGLHALFLRLTEPWNIWVSIVCLVITIQIVFRLFMCMQQVEYGFLLGAVRNPLVPTQPSAQNNQNPFQSVSYHAVGNQPAPPALNQFPAANDTDIPSCFMTAPSASPFVPLATSTPVYPQTPNAPDLTDPLDPNAPSTSQERPILGRSLESGIPSLRPIKEEPPSDTEENVAEKEAQAHRRKWDIWRYNRDDHDRTDDPRINTMQACDSSCPSVVLARINGILFHALLDTGSNICVSPDRFAEKLGVCVEEHMAEAKVANGLGVPLTGIATVQLQIADIQRDVRLCFTSQHVLGKDVPFDMIIGTSALKQFPKMSFDYENCALFMQGRKIRMGKPPSLYSTDIPVRIQKFTIIPPLSETFVNCTLDVPMTCEEHFLVIPLREDRSGHDMQVSPAVISPSTGTFPVLVANPSTAPLKLYTNMKIASGNRLYGNDQTGFSECEESVYTISETNDLPIDPTYAIDLSQCECGEAERRMLRALLNEFPDIFSQSKYDIGCASIEPVSIGRITSDEPIKQKPHRVPVQYERELDDHLQQLKVIGALDDDANVPYVSPIVLVSRKDGSLRPVFDFRRLNAVTEPDFMPIGRIDTILRKISGSYYYSSLDAMPPESSRALCLRCFLAQTKQPPI